MLYGFIDTRAQTFTFFITSPHFFDCNSVVECALMIELVPLYYLENLLSDEILFEGEYSIVYVLFKSSKVAK